MAVFASLWVAVFAPLLGQLCGGPARPPEALSGSAGGPADCLGSVAACVGCLCPVLSGAGEYIINLIRNRLPCQSSASPVVKHYMSQKDRLRVDDEGLLTCVYVRHGQEHRQVVVPKSQVEEILTLSHDDPASGHLGVTKTLEKLRSRFYWSSMFRDVKAWVATCKPCAR